MSHKPKRFSEFIVRKEEEAGESGWRPCADVYRTPDGWLLKFDLAGVKTEDVNVQIQGCRVTVSGRRRDWMVEQGCSHYSMEISYNRFERTIELPCGLENVRWGVEYNEGLLMIRVSGVKEG